MPARLYKTLSANRHLSPRVRCRQCINFANVSTLCAFCEFLVGWEQALTRSSSGVAVILPIVPNPLPFLLAASSFGQTLPVSPISILSHQFFQLLSFVA
jgi:hypothetical protein